MNEKLGKKNVHRLRILSIEKMLIFGVYREVVVVYIIYRNMQNQFLILLVEWMLSRIIIMVTVSLVLYSWSVS